MRVLAINQRDAERRHPSFVSQQRMQQRFAANAATADPNDEDIRSMSEFHGAGAMARALNAKREGR